MTGRTGRLRWRTRLLLILISLSPLILLEAGLWVFSYERPAVDPYRGFVRHEPIFLRDGDIMRPDPRRRELVRHQRFFAARKTPGTLRIFCVGDSTTWAWAGTKVVEGYPEKLRKTLQREYPDRSFDVVNSGVVQFASYRLVGVVREILEYEPDVITLLTGTDEFIEARSYGEWSGRQAREPSWLRRWKTLNLLRSLLAGDFRSSREVEELAERDAFLRADFIDERYIIRDAEEIRATLQHFAHNVRAMVESCRDAGVPIFLCTSPSNLRFPPYQTLYEKESSVALVGRAGKLIELGKAREAVELLTPAIEGDPGAAALHFRLGEAWDALGDSAHAAKAYVRARDRDAFPHRALSEFNEELRRIAEQPGAHLVDLEKVFAAEAVDGIPDYRFFYDNCHFLPRGHELVTRTLFGHLSWHGVLE